VDKVRAAHNRVDFHYFAMEKFELEDLIDDIKWGAHT
jgi:hypothetical protein